MNQASGFRRFAAWDLFIYMDCMTAVSNAGNIAGIERRMGSLPDSSAIERVLLVVMHYVLGVVAGPGPHWIREWLGGLSVQP